MGADRDYRGSLKLPLFYADGPRWTVKTGAGRVFYVQRISKKNFFKKANLCLTFLPEYDILYSQGQRRELIPMKNIPDYAFKYAFIVYRICDGESWFWGAYADRETADSAAASIRGFVLVNPLPIA